MSSEAKPLEKKVAERMSAVKRKVLVMSGKGGVGKSTVAVNLAAALARTGAKVGLLDVDVHGPSAPRLLGIAGRKARPADDGGILPEEAHGISVMSVGLLLDSPGTPVIWRGPMKHTVIGQLLAETEWGELDWLVIDAPPGTGDEPLSVCQLVPDADGAVVVTTPQDVATDDVRRSIGFCRELGMAVLGLVENMSGFLCPKCGEEYQLFGSGGGKRLADETGVPFLGALPLDPAVAANADAGAPFVTAIQGSPIAGKFEAIMRALIEKTRPISDEPKAQAKGGCMRIAIPLAEGKLALHFGHCESFAMLDVEDGKVTRGEDLAAPPHQPGLLPQWLGERGVNLVIAGGMGARARDLFAERGMETLVGAPRETPEKLVEAYLSKTLVSGDNACDH